MNAAVDAFVNTVIDPDKHLHGFPGNTFQTSLAHQTISDESSAYCDEGDVTVYLSEDGLSPVCISNRASVTQSTPTASPVTMYVPPGGIEPTTLFPLCSPMLIGSTFVLFAAPVKFEDGNPPLPGYHMTVSSANFSLAVHTGYGYAGTLRIWHRGADGAFNDSTTLTLNTGTAEYTILIPVNSTAWGLRISMNVAPQEPMIFTNSGGGSHSVTYGNHSSFCRKYTLPDIAKMGVRRGRAIGVKAFVRYVGDKFLDGGHMIGTQFPPGVFPAQFAGDSTAAQIRSAQLPSTHDDKFSKGCVARFVGPTPDHYLLSSAPRRFGESGFTIINWSSNSETPQHYNINVYVAFEYTSNYSFIPRQVPAFATPDRLSVAVELLNRMQMITENPMHEYVSRLWDKLKSKALHIATSPKTWYTIAEVGGALAAL